MKQAVTVYFHNRTNIYYENVLSFKSLLINSKLVIFIKYKDEEYDKVKIVKFYDILGYSFLDTEYPNNFKEKEKKSFLARRREYVQFI